MGIDYTYFRTLGLIFPNSFAGKVLLDGDGSLFGRTNFTFSVGNFRTLVGNLILVSGNAILFVSNFILGEHNAVPVAGKVVPGDRKVTLRSMGKTIIS